MIWLASIAGVLFLGYAVFRWMTATNRKCVELIEKASQAALAGDLVAEEEYAQKALAAAKRARIGRSGMLGFGHFAVAGACLHQQKWAEAEAAGRLAMEKFEKDPAWSHMTYTVISPLAQALMQQRKLDDAQRLIQRFLDASAGSGSALERSVLFGTLAMVADCRGESRRATELFDQGIRMIEETMKANPSGPTELSIMLAEMKLNRANALRRRDPDAAIAGYLEVVQVMERHAPHNDHLAMALSNAAVVMELTGRHEESERTHRRALEFRERHLPPHDPRVGISLNNLANALLKLNKVSEAEQAAERSGALLGSGDPLMAAAVKATKASVRAAQGRHAEALPLFEEAVSLTEEVHGALHPEVLEKLHDMLPTLDALGRTEEAASRRRQMARIEAAFADA